MRHLRFVEDPNYKAYCIRKNSSAIMASGGLFQEAVKLYSQYDPNIKIRLKDQKIVFTSGAEISFSHYENANAAKKYQGKFDCLVQWWHCTVTWLIRWNSRTDNTGQGL